MWVRIKFNLALGPYISGEMYDVEDTEEIRLIIKGGLADIVPYPEAVGSAEME